LNVTGCIEVDELKRWAARHVDPIREKLRRVYDLCLGADLSTAAILPGLLLLPSVLRRLIVQYLV
jgi:hypothetical protein